MSLGFIPVLVTILLSMFITQYIAIGVGMALSWSFSIFTFLNRTKRPPNFMLYMCTLMLSVLYIASFIPGGIVSQRMFAITLELVVSILALLLLLQKPRLINHYLKHKAKSGKNLFIQGTESTFVAVNIYLLFVSIHLLLVLICILFFSPFSIGLSNFLFQYIPPSIFVFTMLFNQLGLNYFNKLALQTEYFATVNPSGEVIGKTLAAEAFHSTTEHIYPVIRIAVMYNGMLYLSKRPSFFSLDPDKVDLPLESYLRFGEDLAAGCRRILRKRLPSLKGVSPTFSIKYRFDNDKTNRLVYLFILDLKNEEQLIGANFIEGKLWQVQQIEQNLGCGYFSECFENEFDYLKDIIDIKEKYKAS